MAAEEDGNTSAYAESMKAPIRALLEAMSTSGPPIFIADSLRAPSNPVEPTTALSSLAYLVELLAFWLETMFQITDDDACGEDVEGDDAVVRIYRRCTTALAKYIQDAEFRAKADAWAKTRLQASLAFVESVLDE
jgi:hypothetical protein